MRLSARARVSLVASVMLAVFAPPAVAGVASPRTSDEAAGARSVSTAAAENGDASVEETVNKAEAQPSTTSDRSDSSSGDVGDGPDQEADEPASAGLLERVKTDGSARVIDETVGGRSAETKAVTDDAVAQISTTAARSVTRVSAKAERLVDKSEKAWRKRSTEPRRRSALQPSR